MNEYQPIIFTNGVFDILHAGHIKLLEECRSIAEDQQDLDLEHRRWEVVVGVNTDDSVKRIKGTHRPIIPLKHRIKILSAIRYVDRVIPFSEETPEELIGQLRPYMLVKGNYPGKPEDLPGFLQVHRVHVTGQKSDISTTELIKRAGGAALAEPLWKIIQICQNYLKK